MPEEELRLRRQQKAGPTDAPSRVFVPQTAHVDYRPRLQSLRCVCAPRGALQRHFSPIVRPRVPRAGAIELRKGDPACPDAIHARDSGRICASFTHLVLSTTPSSARSAPFGEDNAVSATEDRRTVRAESAPRPRRLWKVFSDLQSTPLETGFSCMAQQNRELKGKAQRLQLPHDGRGTAARSQHCFAFSERASLLKRSRQTA